MTFEDRIGLAADDFRVGRTWPEIAQGVRLMWDQVGVFIAIRLSIDAIYSSVFTSDSCPACRYTKRSRTSKGAK